MYPQCFRNNRVQNDERAVSNAAQENQTNQNTGVESEQKQDNQEES